MFIFLGMGVLFFVLGIGMAVAWFLAAQGTGLSEDLLGLGITGLVFAVVGAIFTVIGIASVRSSRRDARLQREGLAGTAVIRDIAGTNMSVNDRPMLQLTLEVTVPGRSPYTTQKRIVMPWNAMGRMGIGATVPVKVDREDPEAVWIDWAAASPMPGAAMPQPGLFGLPGMGMRTGSWTFTAGQPASPQSGEEVLSYLRSMGVDLPGPLAALISAAGPAQVTHLPTQVIDARVASAPSAVPSTAPPGVPPAVPSGMPSSAVPSAVPLPAPVLAAPEPQLLDVRKDADDLQRSGLRGRALIRGSEDLGVAVGDRRLIRLDLEVTPEGRPPYPLQHAEMIPETSTPRLAMGSTLAVRIDPANPHHLVIDWDGA